MTLSQSEFDDFDKQFSALTSSTAPGTSDDDMEKAFQSFAPSPTTVTPSSTPISSANPAANSFADYGMAIPTGITKSLMGMAALPRTLDDMAAGAAGLVTGNNTGGLLGKLGYPSYDQIKSGFEKGVTAVGNALPGPKGQAVMPEAQGFVPKVLETGAEIATPFGGYLVNGVTRGLTGAAPELEATGAALAKKASDAYKAVDESRAQFEPLSVKYFVDQAKSELGKQGYVPSEHTRISSALDDLVNKPPEDLTPAGMNAYMKRLGTIGGDEKGLAGILKGKVRNYLDNVQPADMASGSPEEAGLVRKASSLWAQKSRDEALDEAFRQVDLKAAGTTAETATKNAFRSLANDDMFMNGLSDEVKAAVENAARTGKVEKGLRAVGQLNPLRGGLLGTAGALMGGGAVAGGGPLLAVPAAAGLASDLAYGGMVASKASKAAGMVRQLGKPMPTYPEQFGGMLRRLLQ